MRDIRRRIRSIKSTMQITRGMELVASAKLVKARKAFEAAKPYSQSITHILKNTAKSESGVKHILLTGREAKNELFIVITSDRGLCGGYNSNLIKEVVSRLDKGIKPSFIVTGIRGAEHLRARGCSIIREYPGISDNPGLEHAADIADRVLELIDQGDADRVSLAYNRFVSAISQQPEVFRLIPPVVEREEHLSAGHEESRPAKQEDLLSFEPSRSQVLDTIIPLYIRGMVYAALVEASASEQAARRIAMGAATDNAESMIEELTLSYNRARQELITREITEIIGGAEAIY
jgi:F-type H+-transporting ATPase subunit gamma